MSKVKPMTAMAVRRSAPGTELADTGEYQGLRCSITTAGARFWYRYRCPLTQKLKSTTIGYLSDDMTLVDARQRVLELKAQRNNGFAPVKAQAPASAYTVADMSADYLKKLTTRRKPKSVSYATFLMSKVTAAYGDLPIDALGVESVRALALAELKAGNNRQAGALLGEIGGAIDSAMLQGHLPLESINPVPTVKRLLKAAGEKTTGNRRSRYLTDNEIALWVRWLPESNFTDAHKRALLMTLYTGARTGESISAAWRDIDLDTGKWHLPKTKTDAPRTIGLPRQLVELLTAARAASNNEWVCPNRNGDPTPQKTLGETMWRYRRNGGVSPIAEWVPHDIRRTVRTGLSRLRCPQEVAEAALGHTSNSIVGTYNLHRYEIEVAEWLQRWADHVDDVLCVNK